MHKILVLLFAITFCQITYGQSQQDPPKNIILSRDSTISRNIDNYNSMVAPIIVGTDAFLQGKYLEIGIRSNGSLLSSAAPPIGFHPTVPTNQLGMVVDYGRDGWSIGTPPKTGDYFRPGSPFEGFKVEFNGIVYSNNIAGSFGIPGNNISVISIGSRKVATWQGEVAGKFTIKQVIEIDTNESYVNIDAEIQNISSVNANIYYSRISDPDQEYEYTSNYSTNNTIVNQYGVSEASVSHVKAIGKTNGFYLGYGSTDPRSKVFISNPWDLNPSQYYSGAAGAKLSGATTNDDAIGITFYEPSLTPSSKVIFLSKMITRQEDEILLNCLGRASMYLEKPSIYSGTNTNLVINFSGTSPWSFTLNGQSYLATSTPFVINVSPTSTTTYSLSNISNSCGVNLDVISTTLNVIPCNLPTATMTGGMSISSGSNALLTVNLTGIGPWNFQLNDVTYTTNTTPFLINVSPPITTTYTLSNLSNYCGISTSIASATVTVVSGCDPYEATNSSTLGAVEIESAPFISGQICIHGTNDIDWYKLKINGKFYYFKVRAASYASSGNYRLNISLVAGILTIEVIDYNSSSLDSYLELYDSNGSTMVAYDDDSGVGTFSKIMYAVCPIDISHLSITPIADTYNSVGQISSSVDLNNETYYYAKNNILLLPGFQVGNNETFLAQIRECRIGNILTVVNVLEIKPGLTDGQDGEVNTSYPNTVNFNGNGVFLNPASWTYSGTPRDKRAYIKFPLSSFPTSATIDSAFLYLYYSQTLTDNYPLGNTGGHYGENQLLIKRATSDWTESTLVWNNKPSVTSTNEVIVAAATNPKQNYKISVKTILQDIIANTNYGFEIRHLNESIYKSTCLTSSEEPNENIRPKLVIYYH